MARKRSNPNGANQYQLDPRQKLCWDYYINPKSETFSSGLASAIKAGYQQSTAEQITVEDWFIEKLRTLNMLDKAEKVLNIILEFETESLDEKRLRIQQDSAKFVAERVGKAKYSTRTELTGADGKDLPQPIMELNVRNNNSDKANNNATEEDQGNTRGNISVKDNLNPNILDSLSPTGQG